MRRLNERLISFNEALAFHKRKLHAKQSGKITQKNNLVDNIGLKTFRGGIFSRNGSDERFHGRNISEKKSNVKRFSVILSDFQFFLKVQKVFEERKGKDNTLSTSQLFFSPQSLFFFSVFPYLSIKLFILSSR